MLNFILGAIFGGGATWLFVYFLVRGYRQPLTGKPVYEDAWVLRLFPDDGIYQWIPFERAKNVHLTYIELPHNTLEVSDP